MTDVQNLLLVIHSSVRWFILSLAVVGAARSFVSLFTRDATFMRLDIGLSNAYSALLDLQGLVGVLLIISASNLQTAVPWLHVIIMLPAIVVGHLNRRFRDRPDRVRHQVQLGIFIGSLFLVVIGLAVINQFVMP